MDVEILQPWKILKIKIKSMCQFYIVTRQKSVGKYVRPALHEASIIIINNPSLLLLIRVEYSICKLENVLALIFSHTYYIKSFISRVYFFLDIRELEKEIITRATSNFKFVCISVICNISVWCVAKNFFLWWY